MKQAANGTNPLTPLNGYNMEASTQSVTYDDSGTPIIPDPLETQYVPQYSIQGYASIIDGWVANTDQQPSVFEINLSAGEQSSYEDLGFTEAQGNASFSQFPVNVDVNGLMAQVAGRTPAMFQKVRPTQILVASGISMEIIFDGDAKTAFDQDYEETVQGGGSISIFGFRIGASGSSEEENPSHESTWDSSTGTLTILSENSCASANVLAVMGKIVSA
ncbi:hypothetical protein COL940_012136 [Colletotrichum noveboracense]|nr:hypothetical protein COL940_012136 [Colletotrichum noveboracense]KAJ0275103.1 hypothetical protein CBS470a_011449 [Colletotrichum nupharicola]